MAPMLDPAPPPRLVLLNDQKLPQAVISAKNPTAANPNAPTSTVCVSIQNVCSSKEAKNKDRFKTKMS